MYIEYSCLLHSCFKANRQTNQGILTPLMRYLQAEAQTSTDDNPFHTSVECAGPILQAQAGLS